MKKMLNILVPMAGKGSRFVQANYSFPKPLIDVNGKPMIQLIIENLKPLVNHRFIFICQKEHFEKYSLNEIFNTLTGRNFECIQITSVTEGAVCTALTAIDFINNENDLIIANSDQLVDIKIDKFINFARKSKASGTIMTFQASHPRWSYARVDKKGNVLEVAEKKVISNNATVGIYYFKTGRKFVDSALTMIEKNIRVNNEFYVCPVYNEIILKNEIVNIYPIKPSQMHGLGTPEDLNAYLNLINKDNTHFS